MKRSIFDSKVELKIYKRLKTFWSKYVDVFTQIPIKNIVNYDEIIKFNNNPKVQNFLLKTSFDFVVCELNTGIPILIIEFDGLSGGFSQNGKFIMKKIPEEDKYRKLKMDTKLSLCSKLLIPMIVISYFEIEILLKSEGWISILDAIIGDAIENRYHENNYSKYVKMLTEAYEFGGQESVDITCIEIDLINEQYNPIKRKIREITQKFPSWPLQIVFPKEEKDKLYGLFRLTYGLKTINGSLYTKCLLKLDLTIRKVNTVNSDFIFLFNTIGEYCLARKAEKEIGTNRENWQKFYDQADWVKF